MAGMMTPFLGRMKMRYDAISLRLTVLAVACVAPFSLIAGLMVYEAYQQKSALIEQHMMEMVQALNLTLDGVLSDAQSALSALATSPHLQTGDMAGFHAQSIEVTNFFPNTNIILADEAGQQIINTYRPYGDKLPKRNAPDLVRRVFESGKPTVGDVFLGALTKRPLIAVDVPVIRDGKVKYDLSMTLPAEKLGAALDRLTLPPRWSAAIFDRNNVAAGQLGDSPRIIGQKAPADLIGALLTADRATMRVLGLDSAPAIAVSVSSAETGWKAAVFVPVETFDQELRNWLAWLIVGSLSLLAVGVILALRVAGGINRSIKRLVEPALALGRGEKVVVQPSGLRETDAVCAALNDASRLMTERGVQRDLALAEMQAGAEQLQRQHDGLRALNEIAAVGQTDLNGLLEAALTAGLRRFGLKIGIISRVDGRKYIIHTHVAPAGVGLENGAVFDLGDTYCALTLDAAAVTAISHMRASSYAGHPCYDKFGLESYIGAPLIVGGKRFGTVNFSAPEPTARPFDDGDEEFIGLLARWIGATMERQSVMDELARANTELEQFAYIASHDLREPLRHVSSYVTLLERRCGECLSEEGRELFSVVRNGAKRMNRLLHDMQEYTEIGRRGRAVVAVDLPRAVAEAVAELAPAIHETGAEIIGVEGLPTVGGDPKELAQAFFYLIDNAVKYRAANRRPVIDLSAQRKKNGWWTICVADNGVGVAEEHNERIFRIFQRLHDRSAHDGTGIGLAGVKKIVERLGGRIRLESVVEAGSRFYITLPPAPDVEDGAAP
jgi:signal transduction histidine kinase